MSTKSYKYPKLSEPKKAISIIGIVSEENLDILGLSASSGKEFLIVSIASLISSAAILKSVPQLNSISIFDSDSLDFDFIVFTLLTEETTPSINLVIDFSTSSGPALLYLVFTLITGISISGK